MDALCMSTLERKASAALHAMEGVRIMAYDTARMILKRSGKLTFVDLDGLEGG